MVSSPDDIREHLANLEREEKAIKQQLIDICFFMKGGISWNEAWGLSYLERDSMIKTINKRNREMSGDTREYM